MSRTNGADHRRLQHSYRPKDWGSGNHEIAVKKGQMANVSPDVRAAYEVQEVLPHLVSQSHTVRRVHYNQARLICIYCGWVPKSRQWLEEWEGGFVCMNGDRCQERQQQGGRYYGE